MMINAGILTISDKGSRGLRQDKSTDAVRDALAKIECTIVKSAIVPDERELISGKLTEWADGGKMISLSPRAAPG
jgi:molybdopterin biosynthesis enzyme MoaB